MISRLGVRSLPLMVCLSSCGTVAPDIQRITRPDHEGVIFSKEYATQTIGCGVSALWTPTRKLVNRFEERFKEYQIQHHVPGFVAGYHRQYLGVTNYKTGQKILRVELYCPMVSHWQECPMPMVADGAECLCAALFDPQSKEVVAFGCQMLDGFPYPSVPMGPRRKPLPEELSSEPALPTP